MKNEKKDSKKKKSNVKRIVESVVSVVLIVGGIVTRQAINKNNGKNKAGVSPALFLCI